MPITPPSSTDVHISSALTNYSEFWLQERAAFIGMEGMPNNPVQKEFDTYHTWDRADLYRDEFAVVADGGVAPDMRMTKSTDTYAATVRMLRKPITTRQQTNQDPSIQLQRRATAALMQKAMIQRDRHWVTTFFGSTIWTATGTDTTPSVKWDIPATSTPIQDIRDGIFAVSLSGLEANRITFGKRAWNTFLSNDQVLDRVQGGATNAQPALVTRQLVAQVFELERVDVIRSVFNSATPGDAEVLAPIGDDDVLIYHAPIGTSEDSPTAGMQFSWAGLTGSTDSGIRIRTYTNTERETDYVEALTAYDFKVTASELGFFIPNVTT